jgi:hypothetical protein
LLSRLKIKTLDISGWLKGVGDRWARQCSLPVLNDRSAEPSHAARPARKPTASVTGGQF